MDVPNDRKQTRFNQADALAGIGFAILIGCFAMFYSAGHQVTERPSYIQSDPQ